MTSQYVKDMVLSDIKTELEHELKKDAVAWKKYQKLNKIQEAKEHKEKLDKLIKELEVVGGEGEEKK